MCILSLKVSIVNRVAMYEAQLTKKSLKFKHRWRQ